ncbi:YajQ family cyclic di-GMP-binding protein [Azospirillum griseum]|uniref:Nucleotide-binding protein EJ903_06920 n=1 Tax=Azospirillum griseum TaxID=2496639 RepID=A0A3S0HZB6_9PROT|nr:YajQ family cyclic di-GMP-binding protein [Azospirillum griseum]RTR22541.1 YajQ family cyclic di-GMP-binding protein [Azospirillum griseum]
MPSFDIVSKTDIHEIDNAIAGVRREIETRFDFKGSKCTVERTDNTIVLLADDEPKLLQMQELLRVYVTRRKLDASALDFSTKPERAANDALRHSVTVKQGIAQELAKRIVKSIKDSKMKVQVSIQGDELRVSGKKRDDLQEAIAHVKRMGIEQPLQYDNFRD